MNVFHAVGNLVNDPAFIPAKDDAGENTVVNPDDPSTYSGISFRIAVDGNTDKMKTYYALVVAWGDVAKALIEQGMVKGSKVALTGYLQTRKTKTGSVTEVVVETANSRGLPKKYN